MDLGGKNVANTMCQLSLTICHCFSFNWASVTELAILNSYLAYKNCSLKKKYPKSNKPKPRRKTKTKLNQTKPKFT